MGLVKRHINLITLSFVILAGIFLGFAFFYDGAPPPLPSVHGLRSWQEADAALGYPVEVTQESDGRIPEFDSRFLLLDAIERFSIPLAREFEAPLGTESGALSVREVEFGAEFGAGRLWGEQLGGIGGGGTDLGDPVYAIGNGLVIFAGRAGAEWGRVLIVAHRLPDGRLLQSLYGHLGAIRVPRGGLVARGQQIGSVGMVPGRYVADLHFEIRESDGIDLGTTIGSFVQNRLDPRELFSDHQQALVTPLSPEPLLFRERADWRDRLILKNPDKALELFGDD